MTAAQLYSATIYEDPKQEPVLETASINPINPNCRSKVAVEDLDATLPPVNLDGVSPF